ncbi:MAG: hypothetical protein ACT4P7_16545 [Gemmatimonadaceae bacterium]
MTSLLRTFRVATGVSIVAVLTACDSYEYERQKEAQKAKTAATFASAAANAAARGTGREQRSAATARSLGSGVTAGERGAGTRLSAAGDPFVRMAGYVVRGTDESSFRACGSPNVHFIRPGQLAVGEFVQRYRFRAPKPLTPVYFVFKARVVQDTMRVGDNLYDSVVEVSDVMPEVAGERPECARPRIGSMVESREVGSREQR